VKYRDLTGKEMIERKKEKEKGKREERRREGVTTEKGGKRGWQTNRMVKKMPFEMRKGKITYTKLKEEKAKENPSKVKQRKRSRVKGKRGERTWGKRSEGKVAERKKDVKMTRERNKIKRRKWKGERWKQRIKTDMRQEERKRTMMEQGAKKKGRQEWGGGAGERKIGRGRRNSPWGLRVQADEVHSNVKYLKVLFQETGEGKSAPPTLKLHICANVHICPCSLLETCFVYSID
jgi:hypothetical protein